MRRAKSEEPARDGLSGHRMVMTASLNSIRHRLRTGDGELRQRQQGGNNQEGVFPDDTTDAFDNPRSIPEAISSRLKGTSLGIVTHRRCIRRNAAANAVHTSNRGNGTASPISISTTVS